MKKLIAILFSLTALVLAGCGASQVYQEIPSEDFLVPSLAPVVVHLGELTLSTIANPTESFGELGRPDKGGGERGGFSATFVGTGDFVCFVADPEGIEIDLDVADDGDLDLIVGLEADYTGTPGAVLGNFEAAYTDVLGVDHIDDSNLCVVATPAGSLDAFDRPGAPGGRAVVEFCLIETSLGVTYVIVGQTFSVPPDDGDLKFSTAVVEADFTGVSPACPTIFEGSLDEDGAG